MFFCAEVRAGEQQKSGQKGPEHHAHREREGPVDFGEVEPGQGQDVAVLQRFREQTHDDGGGQHGARRNLAVGQHPVDE